VDRGAGIAPRCLGGGREATRVQNASMGWTGEASGPHGRHWGGRVAKRQILVIRERCRKTRVAHRERVTLAGSGGTQGPRIRKSQMRIEWPPRFWGKVNCLERSVTKERSAE